MQYNFGNNKKRDKSSIAVRYIAMCVVVVLLFGALVGKLIDLQLRMVTDAGVNYGLAGGSYPNLFDAHPPFQIDGNFGVCAGIAEMLLQGDAEKPLILPALPASWKSGSVRGLKLRGNKTVDITWRDGKATEVVIA